MIDITNLTFGYSKKVVLFKDLNLKLEGGHIYGLLGKNGAGKSTLLKNLAGLVYPQQGSCKINNYTAADRLPGFLQDVFFIPDEFYIPSFTARQYTESTSHFYPAFNQQDLYKMLDLVEVPQYTRLDKLSLGQQKKFMICFGIATNTSVLIMDEPTNGLDIPSKTQFRKIMAAALSENRCIIISSHQIRDLDSLIDRLLVLHEQEIVLNSSLDTIAEKLNFSTKIRANPAKILYTEDNNLTANTISINDDEQYSKVDMELLFNALISGNKTLTDLLN